MQPEVPVTEDPRVPRNAFVAFVVGIMLGGAAAVVGFVVAWVFGLTFVGR